MLLCVIWQKLVEVSNVLTASIIRVTIEAVSPYETSVNFCQSTRRNIPEDNYLHTRRLENQKSRILATTAITVMRLTAQVR
jgi:hypothetical protein